MLGIMSNMEAEVKGFLFGLDYCKRKGMDFIIMKTNSLVVRKINNIIAHMTIRIKHTFREANQLADIIANVTLQDGQNKYYNSF